MPKMFSAPEPIRSCPSRGSNATAATFTRTTFNSSPGVRVVSASGSINRMDKLTVTKTYTPKKQVVAKAASTPVMDKSKFHSAKDWEKKQTKHCTKCSKKLPLTDFPKNADSSDGRGAYCRDCKSEISKERRVKDAKARFTHYIVSRVNNEFPKEEIPSDLETNLEEYLGYKLWELRKALRMDLSLIGMGLTRSFREGWHLDHVKPHSTFPKHKIGDSVFQECWGIANLKMIPAFENLSKGAKNIETLSEIAQKEAKLCK